MATTHAKPEPPKSATEATEAIFKDVKESPPEEVRYGWWACYLTGFIRIEVQGHTRAEAIQAYKNQLGLRRNDLPIDCKRLD